MAFDSSDIARPAKYVVGLMFSPNLEKVALIRKRRPTWQIGKLNGIGGHIEGDEAPGLAMAREFEEEAGGPKTSSWVKVAEMSDSYGGYILHVFTAKGDIEGTGGCKSKTEEKSEIWPVRDILMVPEESVVSSLKWLILMSINHLNSFGANYYEIIDRIY